MVVNYILSISCLLFWKNWLFPKSTTLSRVINGLFKIKTYLIRHAFVIPAKISFCWLTSEQLWTTHNDSQRLILSEFFGFLIGDSLLETVKGNLFKKCFHVVWRQHTFCPTIPSDKYSLGVDFSSWYWKLFLHMLNCFFLTFIVC